MIDANRVLPECFIDTLLVRFAIDDKPRHMDGIGEVAKLMRNSPRKLLVGVVDNDKNLPPYFKDFEIIERKAGLLFKKHNSFKHYLIFVDPDCENWLFETANSLGVNTKQYGFKDVKSLKRATKRMAVVDNPKVKDFLNTLKQKKGSPIKTMRRWIEDVFK